MRFPWSTTHGMPLHSLHYSEIWHLHEISLVNDTWHAIAFPILFRNLIFKWDFLGQRHMACRYISYTIQKFKWDFLGQQHMACLYIPYTIQKCDIYMRFPWSTTHEMLLHFLYYSKIWHLHEIPLVNDTWHAVTFPILFKNLTFNNAWHAITFPILFRNLTFKWDSFG